MLFSKFALTRPNPEKKHSENWIGYITIYLPDSKGKLGDIQASMTTNGNGIGVSNSSGGNFTRKFGIRTELNGDELKTLSEFLMSRGTSIVEALAMQDRIRRTYVLAEPFSSEVPTTTRKTRKRSITQTVTSVVFATHINGQIPMEW
jgi:hypothetical protein